MSPTPFQQRSRGGGGRGGDKQLRIFSHITETEVPEDPLPVRGGGETETELPI